jgi:hypothetical protein
MRFLVLGWVSRRLPTARPTAVVARRGVNGEYPNCRLGTTTCPYPEQEMGSQILDPVQGGVGFWNL